MEQEQNNKKEYRIKEEIGQYWNKRWEVQEKYSYYENGELVTSWHMVYHSKDRESCEEVLKKYQTMPQKNYRYSHPTDIDDSLPFMR